MKIQTVLALTVFFLCNALFVHAAPIGESSDPARIREFIERGRAVKNPTPLQLCALGSALMWTKQYDEALKIANAAVNADPNYADAYRLRGQIFKSTKKFPEALENLNKSLTLDPNQPGLVLDRAHVKLRLRDFKGALSDVEKDFERSPDKAFSLCIKGAAECELGEAKKGIESLTKSIQLNPTDPLAVYIRGAVYEKLGLQAEAKLDFERAASLGYRRQK